MAPLRKVILTPWFGPFPEWFDLFIADFNRTMKPQGYDWWLETDLEDFKKRVKDKLGIDYPGVRGSSKVHDYRCALGMLYEEGIKEFDFWGHVDYDVVWGSINKFVPDSLLAELDIYSGHNEYINGSFSLYRNSPEVNSLFKEYPHWIEELTSPKASGWVETHYSRTLEQSGLRYTYDFPQGNPFTINPILKKTGNDLFQEIDLIDPVRKGTVWQEIGFFHFRRSKVYPL